MKRPVLGIIAIFCLQLGFVAYTAVERSFDRLIVVNEVTSDTNPIADTTAILIESESQNAGSIRVTNRVKSKEITVSTPRRRTNIRPAGDALVSVKKILKVPVPRPVNRMPQSVAVQMPSKTRTLTEYPDSMLLDDKSKNSKDSTLHVQKKENKSLISKSVSIIKKPYDWLKALGSKIR